ASPMITPGERTPALHTHHSAKATAAWALCMVSSTVRRWKRAASVPPTAPRIEAENRRENPASPTHEALSVSLNTTNGTVTFWTQPPVLEITAPTQNRQKLR